MPSSKAAASGRGYPITASWKNVTTRMMGNKFRMRLNNIVRIPLRVTAILCTHCDVMKDSGTGALYFNTSVVQ